MNISIFAAQRDTDYLSKQPDFSLILRNCVRSGHEVTGPWNLAEAGDNIHQAIQRALAAQLRVVFMSAEMLCSELWEKIEAVIGKTDSRRTLLLRLRTSYYRDPIIRRIGIVPDVSIAEEIGVSQAEVWFRVHEIILARIDELSGASRPEVTTTTPIEPPSREQYTLQDLRDKLQHAADNGQFEITLMEIGTGDYDSQQFPTAEDLADHVELLQLQGAPIQTSLFKGATKTTIEMLTSLGLPFRIHMQTGSDVGQGRAWDRLVLTADWSNVSGDASSFGNHLKTIASTQQSATERDRTRIDEERSVRREALLAARILTGLDRLIQDARQEGSTSVDIMHLTIDHYDSRRFRTPKDLIDEVAVRVAHGSPYLDLFRGAALEIITRLEELHYDTRLDLERYDDGEGKPFSHIRLSIGI